MTIERHPWTTPAQLRAHTEKLWIQGKLLAALCDTGPAFPLRLPLRAPDSRALSDDFAAVRAWSRALLDAAAAPGRPGYRVELRDVHHRIIGSNRLPAEIWLDTPDAAFALIGRCAEGQHFRAALTLVREREPALASWFARRPLRALALAEKPENWPRLLDVVAWLRAHPRPGCYLRQVDLPGVDTKFIEQHQGVLAELFDLALPPHAADVETGRPAAFARRYGFRDKPERVRMRFLDPVSSPLPMAVDHDITLTAMDFARLNPGLDRVFITENEINFLAFPRYPRSLVVLGGGYGFSALAEADWLRACEVHYWGDIDTHGFAILSQLRSSLSRARSLLMDREVLLAHGSQWVSEPSPTHAALPHLTATEAALLTELREDRLGHRVRLEQERVGFEYVISALKRLNS